MQVLDLSDAVGLVLASAGVFLCAGMVQAVTGFGLALAAVPVLSLFVETSSVVVGTIAVGAVVTGLAWRRERSHVDVVAVRRLCVAAIVGMPWGLAVLTLVSERTLTLTVSAVVLGLAMALLGDLRLPSGPFVQAAAGFSSGALLTSTSMNGPPLVLALHGSGMTPHHFRATLQAIFFVQGTIAVVVLGVLGHIDAVVIAIWVGGIAGIWPGWKIGDRLFGRLSTTVFRRLILAGLALTAVVSAATAVAA